ncbi:SH3 domain-containing protein [Massilia sp. IC2-477]|uniref:SH3 domain-containing protein n=1 Tax=Massilia sp. IC2-477 TaxID=2887198 RepID=UPI001D106E16|nr:MULTISPECIES: SH3 domain-containing protein [unclassified Massilia]MCC2955130.1 SH3 domain-containing protein [Massilia sp. IC2-477]MCC2974651.1 SH3 domain-containing protein [Massilia sp. IC2-476]
MLPIRLLASVLLLAAPAAFAFDFRSVGAAPAILYDTPSSKGARMYVAPQGMPLQVLSSYADWVKVRDANGDLAWTPAKGLSARRNLVVRTPGAKVFAGPDESSQVLMTADKGVILELVDPTALTWIRVRHRDGIDGYVRANDVWGL